MTGFVDQWKVGSCRDCSRPLKNLATTHLCGGASGGVSYALCDNCAADERLPDGRPRWGFTRADLEVERIRRSVYAAGGGETEVRAALEARS